MITFSVFKENPFSIEIIIFLFYTGNISYNRKKYNSHIGRKYEKMQINTAFFKKTIDERHVL